MSLPFYLYILQCADNTYYIGHTDNLDARMAQHEVGSANSYTNTRRPLRLVFAQEFETRYDALTAERMLKGWSRAKKQAYMAGDWNEVSRLARGKDRPGTAR